MAGRTGTAGACSAAGRATGVQLRNSDVRPAGLAREVVLRSGTASQSKAIEPPRALLDHSDVTSKCLILGDTAAAATAVCRRLQKLTGMKQGELGRWWFGRVQARSLGQRPPRRRGGGEMRCFRVVLEAHVSGMALADLSCSPLPLTSDGVPTIHAESTGWLLGLLSISEGKGRTSFRAATSAALPASS
jgi:hypothetical protein